MPKWFGGSNWEIRASRALKGWWFFGGSNAQLRYPPEPPVGDVSIRQLMTVIALGKEPWGVALNMAGSIVGGNLGAAADKLEEAMEEAAQVTAFLAYLTVLADQWTQYEADWSRWSEAVAGSGPNPPESKRPSAALRVAWATFGKSYPSTQL